MFALHTQLYTKHLENLKAILEKAISWQAEAKLQDDAILQARLALDMFPFVSQVRFTTNYAKSAIATYVGETAPSFTDDEKTLVQLIERIDKTLAYIASVSLSSLKDDLDTRLVPLAWMPGKGIVARYYVEEYALSNFFFHYTTAYDILRHYGLQIGKGDYLGNVSLKDLA
jgi:hypothetical protein